MNLFKAIRSSTLGLLLLGASADAEDLQIDDVRKQPGRVEVRFNRETEFYYILWRGERPTEIRFATDLARGRGTSVPDFFLADTNATNAALFYRVEKVLMAAQRDTDGDGICDAWELLYRQPGAALNPGDASEDHNGNGISDLTEARRESFREGAVRGRPVLAAGLYHSLAIRQGGTLWGWGDNLFGQLGSSSFTETTAPAQIGTDTNWLAVSCALFTSYGLKMDGTLWYWGLCNTGNVFAPTQIGTNRNWIGLPKGQPQHNPTALQADGSRWQFVGSFTNAQLLGLGPWFAVSDDTSSGHWAIDRDGRLQSGSFSHPSPVWSAVSIGYYHVLALQTNGTLWQDGNFFGPVDGGTVGGPSGNFFQVGTNKWAAVSSGAYHALGIQSDGSLWWWGANEGFAPRGNGLKSTNVPTRFGTNTDWLAVSAGDSHALALREDGTIWTFGFNEAGRLGNGTVGLLKEPTRIGTDTDWTVAAIGNRFSFGVKSNGTLWAWGANPYGSLGVGDFAYSAVPRQVPGSNWISVSGGYEHSVGLQSDGSLWVWGKYFYGTNSSGDVWTNAPTRLGTESNWVRISAGLYHSLAMKADRSLWAWGKNSNGALGNGESSGIQNAPVLVLNFGGSWTNFSAGYSSSLGVRDGALMHWGLTPGGSPGSGFPQQVTGDLNWLTVANAKLHRAFAHMLALKNNGTLWAWGRSTSGQLGTNVIVFAGSPTQVGTGTNWNQIAAGDQFSAALQTDGTLWMTGDNSFGQLGFGTRVNTNLFTKVGADTDWTSVAAGYQHTVALKSNGTLWAWGDNSYGQCAQPANFEPSPVAGTNWGRTQ